MASRKKRARRRKPRPPSGRERTIGFWCAWCSPRDPKIERFVPFYYRSPEGHRPDAHMCLACFLELLLTPEKSPRRHKPLLNAQTLEQFWLEDTTRWEEGSKGRVKAAAGYFEVSAAEIRETMQEITI